MAGYIGKGQPVVSNGAERKFKYTATAGQTVFNATYSVGSVHVYRTGVRLTDGVDYTATNGSTVTLTTGCNAGDDVVIVSTSGFQVADAYTKAELANHDQLTVQSNGRVLAKEIIDLSTTTGSRLYNDTTQSYTYVSSLNPAGSSVANHYHNANEFTVQGNGVDRFKIDSAGRVTMPYQPNFWVSRNSYWESYSFGSVYQFDNVIRNIGGHYDSNTGRFTAPVSGLYQFNFVAYQNDNNGGTNYIQPQINGANVSNVLAVIYSGGVEDNTNTLPICWYLNAGDYVTMSVAGTIYGYHTHWSGYLVG